MSNNNFNQDINQLLLDGFISQELKSPTQIIIDNVIDSVQNGEIITIQGKDTDNQRSNIKWFKYPSENFTLDVSDIPVFNLIPLVKDFEILGPQITFAITQTSIEDHPVLDDTTIYRGLNLDTNVDFSQLNDPVINFLDHTLGIENLNLHLFADVGVTTGLVNFTTTYQEEIPIISIGDFSTTFINPQIHLTSSLTKLKPTSADLGFTGTLLIENYDFTQSNEPDLNLAGTISYDLLAK